MHNITTVYIEEATDSQLKNSWMVAEIREVPGELFAKRYRIVKLLGKGGMGKVYLAADTVLNDALVALKLLNSDVAQEEKHIERFIREVQLTRSVSNPHIVRTFDAGLNNDRLFFTMEYVEGESLKEKLSRGKLHCMYVARMLMQACEGLAAIHAEDIIHRDLKPANMLVSEDDILKITDFGVARPGLSDLTAHDEVVGSATYMAPEVWTGKDIGPPADIYALGISAFELLTGQLPFKAESAAELMWKHIEEQVTWPAEIVAEVPDWLIGLISLLLEKDCNYRPCSAEEIKKYIERGFSGDLSMVGFDINAERYRPTVEAPLDPANLYQKSSASSLEPGYHGTRGLLCDDGEFEEAGIGAALPSESQITGEIVSRATLPGGEITETCETTKKDHRSTKSVLLHVFVSLAIILLLSYCLMEPTADYFMGLWKKATVKLTLFYTIFVTCLISVYTAALCAFPLYALTLPLKNFSVSWRIWRTATISMLVLFSIMLFYNVFRVTHECYETETDLSLESVVSAVEPAAINTLQVAMLTPSGSSYTVEKGEQSVLMKKEIGTGVAAGVSYYVALACFLLLIVTTLRRELFELKAISSRVVVALLIGGTLIVALELGGIAVLHSVVGREVIDKFALQLGAFFIPADNYLIGFSIINWGLLIIALVASGPLWSWWKKKRQK